ncbi:MAG: histidine phosphatase family protein [Rhodobacteraceae bacterium]|nr:histidine phosphatase family protein [Paracoccaceae bacterium]
MIRLALLRHGYTAWNRAGRIQGRSDIALDDAARAGLRRLSLPSDWADADLWSSPLSRAVETAELVTGRAPQTDPALIEMDWGDWEGQRGICLAAHPASGFRHIEDWGWSYRPPGGESPGEVWDRLCTWVRMRDRDTVAICHIGIMRVLMARATGWNFYGPAPFQIKRDRLFVITVDGTNLGVAGDPVHLTMQGSAE